MTFYEYAKAFFASSESKNSWGKREIVSKLKDLYIEFLERETTTKEVNDAPF